MDHNRAASHIGVFPGDALTTGYQAESIRRFADTLGMTIVREYEDEEYGSGQTAGPSSIGRWTRPCRKADPSAPSPRTAAGRSPMRGRPGRST